MKIYEYEAKRWIASVNEKFFGKDNVPNGFVIKRNQVSKAQVPFAGLVVKAQVLHGKRGKAGLIKFCNRDKLKQTIDSFPEEIDTFLVEKKIEHDKEYYLALRVSPTNKGVDVIASNEGGVDIEEVPKTKIMVASFESRNFRPIKLEPPAGVNKVNFEDDVIMFFASLYQLMKQSDATLIEVNPLVWNKKTEKLVALDLKVVVDDNALFRHPDLAPLVHRELTGSEAKAAEIGLHYVDLEGDIGIIGNGAGMVMATVDLVKYFGGEPANFLDVGGGSGQESMEKALEIVFDKRPKGVLINIFGGITRCDNIANAIVKYKDKNGIKVPMVVRMIGTNEEEGNKILKENGITAGTSMEDAAKKIVRLVK